MICLGKSATVTLSSDALSLCTATSTPLQEMFVLEHPKRLSNKQNKKEKKKIREVRKKRGYLEWDHSVGKEKIGMISP
jgi:hypothetical protein